MDKKAKYLVCLIAVLLFILTYVNGDKELYLPLFGFLMGIANLVMGTKEENSVKIQEDFIDDDGRDIEIGSNK